MFKRELLLDKASGLQRMAVVDQGTVTAFRALPEPAIWGNIYRGRVVRWIPGMQAGFVDIGLSQTAFLSAKHTVHHTLKPGQNCWVQVHKLSGGEKTVQVTEKISLVGHLVLYMPHGQGVYYSRRLSPAQQAAIQDWMAGYGSDRARQPFAQGGWVIRYTAADRCADLGIEMAVLHDRWIAIQAEPKTGSLVYQAPEPFAQWVRDEGDQAEVWVSDPADVQRLRTWLSQQPIAIRCHVRQCPGLPFDRHGARALWRHIHQTTLPLPSGGSVLVQISEAMVVMDVNSGGAVQARNPREHARLINQEAIAVIARYILLGNLSGQMWVDLLDMPQLEPVHQTAIRQAFQQAFAADPARVQWHWEPTSGLWRITRQRREPPIWELATHACPRCRGTGRLPVDTPTGNVTGGNACAVIGDG